MGIISALKTESGKRRTENYDFLKNGISSLVFSFQFSAFSFFSTPYVVAKIELKIQNAKCKIQNIIIIFVNSRSTIFYGVEIEIATSVADIG